VADVVFTRVIPLAVNGKDLTVLPAELHNDEAAGSVPRRAVKCVDLFVALTTDAEQQQYRSKQVSHKTSS
jgi:hypothetical protein